MPEAWRMAGIALLVPFRPRQRRAEIQQTQLGIMQDMTRRKRGAAP